MQISTNTVHLVASSSESSLHRIGLFLKTGGMLHCVYDVVCKEHVSIAVDIIFYQPFLISSQELRTNLFWNLELSKWYFSAILILV